MDRPTTDDLKAQIRRAKAAYAAAGGPPALDLVRATDEGLSCEVLLGASAAAYWYAAEAILKDVGDPYASYYLGLGDAYSAMADAQGC